MLLAATKAGATRKPSKNKQQERTDNEPGPGWMREKAIPIAPRQNGEAQLDDNTEGGDDNDADAHEGPPGRR